PTRCMNTALASTPSGTRIGGAKATTWTPGDSGALTAALSSVQCGDTIALARGVSYPGSFTIPSLPCDGAHWIVIKSTGTDDPQFPPEGARATPCIAGLSNDATNGRSVPGYPDYSCPSFPSVLSARIAASTPGQPVLQFASGANHYRFIGVEITKN